jgi:hypothetical protein
MRLDSVDGITVTSVGGGTTVGGPRPAGNAFAYMPSAPSSVAGENNRLTTLGDVITWLM